MTYLSASHPLPASWSLVPKYSLSVPRDECRLSGDTLLPRPLLSHQPLASVFIHSPLEKLMTEGC